MSKPSASIYVPEGKREEWKSALQSFKDKKIGSLSQIVFQLITRGQVLNSQELLLFGAKEARTHRDKYIVVVLKD